MSKQVIYSGIYGIFNLANGKVYVGQTNNFGIRYTQHYTNNGINAKGHRCHNVDLSEEFYLYGIDNFIFIILEYIIFPNNFIKSIDNCKIYLKPYEDKWIDYYESLNPLYGYNKFYGGMTTLGANFYQEKWFKDKCRESALNRPPVSEETRAKMRKNSRHISGKDHPMWNKHPSEETLRKQSESKMGEKNPLWGKSNTISGKEIVLHFPNGENYFITNNLRFCKEFKLHRGHIVDLIKGTLKTSQGVTGERAPKWMVDKVLPLMEEGQYWVEIDIEGNIING